MQFDMNKVSLVRIFYPLMFFSHNKYNGDGLDAVEKLYGTSV